MTAGVLRHVGWVVVALTCFSSICWSQIEFAKKPLLEARANHKTRLTRKLIDKESMGIPPAMGFEVVDYETDVGMMKALIARPKPNSEPKKEATSKRPAIIWLTGGDTPGGYYDGVWKPQDPSNDQSGSAFTKAGFITMYPGIRGMGGNPGEQECFYGEVDDVISAGRYLSKLKGVDPARIYLAGHSTGGTLALLVATATDMFREIFCFGPVADPANYGQESCNYEINNEKERSLRAPILYLPFIKSPTLVIEGIDGNSGSAADIEKSNKNPKLRVIVVPRANHFNILAPTTKYLAELVVRTSNGPAFIEKKSIFEGVTPLRKKEMEVMALKELADRCLNHQRLDRAVGISFAYTLIDTANLKALKERAKKAGFKVKSAEADDAGDLKTWTVVLVRKVRLDRLKSYMKVVTAADDLGPTLGCRLMRFWLGRD